ncbi:hypothetical protein IJI91_01755 [Candidatus Saccharibacteria bacterium]|nr:hypothetical protein [Candidatus Saccharibacteria bacterium]
MAKYNVNKEVKGPIIYLVGSVWYSADQGDWPNVREFPESAFSSLREAEAKYEELSRMNKSWGFGFQEAYLVEARNGELKFLKGRRRV